MDNVHLAVPADHHHDIGLPATGGSHHAHQHSGHGHAAGQPSVTGWTAVCRFGLHYLEMLVAMAIGMIALAPVSAWVGGLLGWTAALERADVGSMVMAANMTIGMGAWMKVRGHGWCPIAEMGAAMLLPFAVLLVPLWMGVIGRGALMTFGHLLMLLGMAVAMLLRPDEYIHHRH